MSKMIGPELSFDTPDFIFRSIVRGDETEEWGAWIANPKMAALLNATPRVRTMAELRLYIASFDRVRKHLFGIFEKEGGRLIGIRTAEIDTLKRAFSVHMLVGTNTDWGQGSMDQTTTVLNNWAYEVCDLLWSEATVNAQNRKMIRYLTGSGWSLIAKGMTPSVVDGRMLEMVQLRRHRDIWRKDPRSSAMTGIPPMTGLESQPAADSSP